MFLYIKQSTLRKVINTTLTVAGTSSGDRGAATARGLPEPDAGPQPPRHVAERALRGGGVPRRVAPAPQQGVAGRQQARQCRVA